MQKQYMEKVLDELLSKITDIHFAQAFITERGEIKFTKALFSRLEIEQIKYHFPPTVDFYFSSSALLPDNVVMTIFRKPF